MLDAAITSDDGHGAEIGYSKLWKASLPTHLAGEHQKKPSCE